MAPTTRLVARNTALRAAAEVLGKVASLGLMAVMLHQLGADAVGDFAFALSISQLYWPIAGFGLDRLMLREIAVDDRATARMVPQLNAFKLVVGALCVAFGTAFVALRGSTDTVVWLTFLLGIGLVLTLIGSTAQNVFMAKERTQDFFVAALPVKVFAAVFGVIALLVGGGLISVALTNLVAVLAGIAIGWWILARRYGQKPAALGGTPRSWWRLARESGPWGLQELFGQLMFRVGIIALYLLADPATAGEYAIAYRLLEATLFLPWSIASSILPLIARSRPGVVSPGQPTLDTVSRGAIELVIALMVPVAVLMALCAEPVLALIGEGAKPAATALPYLAVASVVYGVGHIAGLVGLSHLPGRRTVEATAVAAVFCIVCVALLIPPYEERGAALAALLTETALAGLALRLAVKATSARILTSLVSLGLVAGVVMAAVVWPVRDDLWIAAPVGGAVYLIVLGALEYRRQGPAWQLARSIAPGSR